ncbi:hypothetical protein D3C86_1872440 [compost metagenome]
MCRKAFAPNAGPDPGSYILANGIEAGNRVLIVVLQRRKAGSHAEGVCIEGPGEGQARTRIRRIEDPHCLFASANGTNRHTAADDLAKCRQVRMD